MPIRKPKQPVRKNFYNLSAVSKKRHRLGVKSSTVTTTEELIFVSLSFLSALLSYLIIISGGLYN